MKLTSARSPMLHNRVTVRPQGDNQPRSPQIAKDLDSPALIKEGRGRPLKRVGSGGWWMLERSFRPVMKRADPVRHFSLSRISAGY